MPWKSVLVQHHACISWFISMHVTALHVSFSMFSRTSAPLVYFLSTIFVDCLTCKKMFTTSYKAASTRSVAGRVIIFKTGQFSRASIDPGCNVKTLVTLLHCIKNINSWLLGCTPPRRGVILPLQVLLLGLRPRQARIMSPLAL